MEITDLTIILEERDAKEREMFAAIEAYRNTMNNEASSRNEIKVSCNEALRRAGAMIDKQKEIINALILAGQTLAEAAAGKESKPLS